MLFWIAISVILALTMFFVWRAWAVQLGVEISPEQSDVAIYNARIGEIDRDLEAKRLDPEMAEAAKTEEARKLLKSQRDSESKGSNSQPSGWWMTIGLFSLPLVSILIYLSLGTPPHTIAIDPNEEVAEQSMDQLIATAEKRLETNPDDLQGWQVLLPVYMRQQSYDKAANAIRNIIRIGGEKTELFSMLGEIYVAKEQGLVTSEALSAFEKAVELNSGNSDARFFLGLYARQNGDIEKTRSIWQSMIDDADGNEDWIPVMKKRIADLDGPVVQTTEKPSAKEISNLPKDEQKAQILSMVGRLAARLEENPNDKTGWIRLVRAYRVLGENEEAEDAVTSAKKAFPGDPEFITELGEAMKTPAGAIN